MSPQSFVQSSLPNPKQNGVPYVGRSTWFPFYAGFSSVFVNQVFDQFVSSPEQIVCDPWNGAGTTTQIAFDNNRTAIGFDINPVMVRVARARQLSPTRANDLDRIKREVYRNAMRFRSVENRLDSSLAAWFCVEAQNGIHRVRRAISSVSESISDIEKAALEVGVFRTLKWLIRGNRSSNPTWTKKPDGSALVNCTASQVTNLFNSIVSGMIEGLRCEPSCEPNTASVSVREGNSTALDLADNSVDLVLCSPPYCTRIDYAVTTAVELAYLGVDVWGGNRDFRNRITGTTTIRSHEQKIDPRWGKTCLALLDGIRTHASKASVSYYLKTHVQYFDDLSKSIAEIQRVLRISKDAVIVVQDSFYKELHNDLAQIVTEMAEQVGLSLVCRTDFRVKQDLGRVNPRASPRRIEKTPFESVLHFNKRM